MTIAGIKLLSRVRRVIAQKRVDRLPKDITRLLFKAMQSMAEMGKLVGRWGSWSGDFARQPSAHQIVFLSHRVYLSL